MDTQDEHTNALHQIQLKITNLEDSTRQNNKKINEILEYVKPSELTHYLQPLFCAIIPNLSQCDVTINRAQRIQKPKHLPASIPRHTLARVHFFHMKKQIMHTTRCLRTLPDPYATILYLYDPKEAHVCLQMSSSQQRFL